MRRFRPEFHEGKHHKLIYDVCDFFSRDPEVRLETLYPADTTFGEMLCKNHVAVRPTIMTKRETHHD